MVDDGALPEIPGSIRDLLDGWLEVPAFVRDRHLTVVASNELARAVTSSFRPGVNLARFTFSDPSVIGHDAGEWDRIVEQVAGLLRESLAAHRPDPGFREIVGELSATSEAFTRAWADATHEVETSAVFNFPHESVGSMDLAYQQLRLPGDDDLVLVVLRAHDEPSRQRLRRLAEQVTPDLRERW